MIKAIKFLVIALVAVIFIGTFVFLYKKSQPETVQYETYECKPTSIERTTVVTGSIEPRDEVLIKPQISGIISELYKEAGQTVRKGEVIAKVKVVPDMSTLSSAENRLRLAKINNAQAKTDYERTKKLFDEKLISADEYDKVRLAYSQSKEEIAAATDALEIAKEGVSRSTASYSTTLIRSTVDGLILDVPVKVGNSVIMSNTFNDGTTIASVANMSNLIFKGTIDETEVAMLHEGMPVKITIGALQDRVFPANLEYIAPKVSSSTSSANQFEIKAAVSIPAGVKIRAGYSANAEVVLDHLEGVLAVPEGAIEFSGDSSFVYVETSQKPQSFARRQVKTGMSDGMNIQILSGLKKGDKVRGNIISAEADKNNG